MSHEPLDALAPQDSPESRTGAAPPAHSVRTGSDRAGNAGGQATGNADTELLEASRIVEALLFASASPVRAAEITRILPEGAELAAVMASLHEHYRGRGVELSKVGNAWAFRTASDVADRLTVEKVRRRKLSQAGLETLAIVAYHAPVTRAEIEEIRGVTVSPGTLDILFEEGWIEPRGHKQVPGRPTTWQTTAAFLDHFGLESRNDLPGLRDLKKAGLLTTAAAPATPPMGDELAEGSQALSKSA